MQKNIHIDNIERSFAKTGNEKFVLISGKDKYQFWGTEQGEDSTAKKQFEGLGLKPGSDCEIEYLESPESFVNAKGETVNWTQRSIRGIFPASGTPTPLPTQTPTTGQNNAPQGMPNANYKSLNDKAETNNEFWDKKAYKQCLWNYWLKASVEILKAGVDPQQFAQKDMDTVWEVFNQIDQDANKRFSGEMDTSDIPF